MPDITNPVNDPQDFACWTTDTIGRLQDENGRLKVAVAASSGSLEDVARQIDTANGLSILRITRRLRAAAGLEEQR